jgi:hypothetical protein
MGYLFFSYSRRNSTQAQANVEALTAEGFTIWQDVREGDEGIQPGADFEREIHSAIESDDCEGIILQWSKDADGSKWVRREIDLANKANKRIYPLLLDATSLPPLIENNNGIRQEDIDRLIDALYTQASDARRRTNDKFDSKVSLGLQQDAESIGSLGLVKVPIVQSGYTQAHVFGSPKYTIGDQPEHVLLCAEFSGQPGNLFLSEALRYFQKTYENAPYAALHVTPNRTRRSKYVLERQSEWLDAAATCVAAVECFRQQYSAEIHVFAKMPVALGLLLSNSFSTNTVIYIYNDIESADGKSITYTPIARIRK